MYVHNSNDVRVSCRLAGSLHNIWSIQKMDRKNPPVSFQHTVPVAVGKSPKSTVRHFQLRTKVWAFVPSSHSSLNSFGQSHQHTRARAGSRGFENVEKGKRQEWKDRRQPEAKRNAENAERKRGKEKRRGGVAEWCWDWSWERRKGGVGWRKRNLQIAAPRFHVLRKWLRSLPSRTSPRASPPSLSPRSTRDETEAEAAPGKDLIVAPQRPTRAHGSSSPAALASSPACNPVVSPGSSSAASSPAPATFVLWWDCGDFVTCIWSTFGAAEWAAAGDNTVSCGNSLS